MLSSLNSWSWTKMPCVALKLSGYGRLVLKLSMPVVIESTHSRLSYCVWSEARCRHLQLLVAQDFLPRTLLVVVPGMLQLLFCSETTLTGESRFHISPPRRFELVSLVVGSKQVVHWTSGTW